MSAIFSLPPPLPPSAPLLPAVPPFLTHGWVEADVRRTFILPIRRAPTQGKSITATCIGTELQNRMESAKGYMAKAKAAKSCPHSLQCLEQCCIERHIRMRDASQGHPPFLRADAPLKLICRCNASWFLSCWSCRGGIEAVHTFLKCWYIIQNEMHTKPHKPYSDHWALNTTCYTARNAMHTTPCTLNATHHTWYTKHYTLYTMQLH